MPVMTNTVGASRTDSCSSAARYKAGLRSRSTGVRVVLGDFNELTHGLASRLLSTHFQSVDIESHLRRSRTYPGLLPFLHLDHIYFDGRLTLERLVLHRSRTALIASDHLPLVADFRVDHAATRADSGQSDGEVSANADPKGAADGRDELKLETISSDDHTFSEGRRCPPPLPIRHPKASERP
jgi:hypothetical protein